MVIIIEIILSSIDAIRFIFMESYTTTYYFIISVLVVLGCFLTDVFNTFY